MASRSKRPITDYGIVVVLVGLCGLFSLLTNTPHQPRGAAAARQIETQLADIQQPISRIVVLGRPTAEERQFLDAIVTGLRPRGIDLVVVEGDPPDVRRRLLELHRRELPVDLMICSETVAGWSLLAKLADDFPGLGHPRLLSPQGYFWPTFLTAANLLNVANQISVIAIMAIGMTMVIIAGGIDLSVGSQVAFSAVVTGLVIRDGAGALEAGVAGMTLASLIGVVACGCVGLISGLMLTQFRIPPFIMTLGMMLMVGGVASKLTNNESVYQIPDSFTWLGRGATWGIPNAVVLTVMLYLLAWFVMTRTIFGRHLYAVGGNLAAARLSAVPVKRVVVSSYVISALMAGLGGVVMTSNLKSASPSYGAMYELYVIAAVVVGGTSLSGGEGKVLGTLLGALVIAVINNGMNLLNVESNMQRVVLGLLIVGAVLMDRMQRFGWRQRASE
ncbi:MAG: ABC transporter permease [Planctomycetes bacterium]|nr:ABC transporter permease [Planctomycetota bacterium]